MSKASDALDVLRKAGLRVTNRVAQEEQSKEEKETAPLIDYQYEEFPVRSIKVTEMNFGHVKLELVDIEKNEKELESTIRILIEAICMLREEIGEIRLENSRDCPF